jgi:hypothetical protein
METLCKGVLNSHSDSALGTFLSKAERSQVNREGPMPVEIDFKSVDTPGPLDESNMDGFLKDFQTRLQNSVPPENPTNVEFLKSWIHVQENVCKVENNVKIKPGTQLHPVTE